jgi:hypothetical protein
MKIRHLIAAAVAAAFLTLGGGDTALAQTKKKNNVKLSAKKENIILRARIDSLKAELEARDIQDSLAMETAEAELHQAEERTENRCLSDGN